MKSLIPGTIAILTLAISGLAQQPSAPAAESAALILRAGQQIDLVLKTKLSSEHSKAGDVVEFEVVRPVQTDDGLVAIAEGKPATAKVVLAQPRAHRGTPGALAIAFDSVRLVTGDPVALSGKDERHGNDKKAEVNANMGEWTLRTFGFGLPLTPLFMLQKGGGVDVEPGTRLKAYIAADVPIERGRLRESQPAPPDTAVVYLFNAWHPTCGSEALPFSMWQDAALRLDLPPGRYWFHSGAKIGFLGGMKMVAVGSFTFGQVMPEPLSMKKVLKRPVAEFAALDVKGGQRYYLLAYSAGKEVKGALKLLDATEGDNLLAQSAGPYYALRNVSPEMLRNLQEAPRAARVSP